MNDQIRSRIEALVSNILNNKFKHFRNKCPENIKDLVFIEIKINQELREEYNSIKNEFNTVNSYIGRFIKKYWSLEDLKRCYNPQSNLISSYMRHRN